MIPASVALWLQTVPPDTPSGTPHMIEAIGLALAIGLAKVWDARVSHPKIRKERNDELDTRLNNIRQAIKSSTEVIQGDVNALGTDVRVMKGTMDVVAGDVKGLKDRELARLEADAVVTRRGRRR